MGFIGYYLLVLCGTVVQLIISQIRNGKNIENKLKPSLVMFRAFFNCFWPIYITYVLLERFVGDIIPPGRMPVYGTTLGHPSPGMDPVDPYIYEDVQRADSMRSVPNAPATGYNRGGNVSNSPDQL